MNVLTKYNMHLCEHKNIKKNSHYSAGTLSLYSTIVYIFDFAQPTFIRWHL